MIDIIKYNKTETAYHTFCLLIDYVKEIQPIQLRKQNGCLKGRDELHEFIKQYKNEKSKIRSGADVPLLLP